MVYAAKGSDVHVQIFLPAWACCSDMVPFLFCEVSTRIRAVAVLGLSGGIIYFHGTAPMIGVALMTREKAYIDRTTVKPFTQLKHNGEHKRPKATAATFKADLLP